MRAEAGRRRGADLVQEARGGVGQQAVDVVQDLALVGALERGHVEGGRREQRDLEDEETQGGARGQLVRSVGQAVQGRADRAARKLLERRDVERLAVELDGDAVAVDEAPEAQLERDAVGQRELRKSGARKYRSGDPKPNSLQVSAPIESEPSMAAASERKSLRCVVMVSPKLRSFPGGEMPVGAASYQQGAQPERVRRGTPTSSAQERVPGSSRADRAQ